MRPPYIRQQFRLELDGSDQPFTLKGIYTPRLIATADFSNLFPCYIGNVFENGDGRSATPTLLSPLDESNNIERLLAGGVAEFTEDIQYDRLPRTRNWYLERGRLYVMSDWYVRGTAGDVLWVTWYNEGAGFVDATTKVLIDVSDAALSR
jgi:hypothetical protein